MIVLLALLGCPTEIGINDSTRAPEVTLVTPVQGGVFDPDQDVVVCASVDARGVLPEDLQGSVSTDVDGVIATSGFTDDCEGGNFGVAVRLSAAVHTLSLTVTDPLGRGGTDTATISPTGNDAPVCSVVAPETGSIFPEGSEVVVTARVDDEAGDVDVAITSTLDGDLGQSTVQANSNVEFVLTPSNGMHDLVLTVTDDRGEAGVCVVSIEVQECQDTDADGFENCEGDCDDADPEVYPNAPELPDGQDNDCDGTIDEGTVLYDDDGDGTNELDGDCDDTSAGINPNATDIPDDGVDQDCSGSDTVTCFTDGDNDGYGVSPTLLAADGDCFDPGEAPADGDCNDADASINPGAAEVPADGIDQDCDGNDPAGCFDDSDGDGFGSATVLPAGDTDCDDPGESSFGTDCNDSAPHIFPGADEILDDGIDQDCSGADRVTCYVDTDGDSYGRTTVQPEEGTCMVGATNSDDCDDGAAGVNPGATEIPENSVDEDCNGFDAIVCFLDADLDGYGSTTHVDAPDGACDTVDMESTNPHDCNDADQSVNPGATEVPDDGIDQDCDGHDATGTGGCNQAQLVAGDVIISEIMANPPGSSTDFDREWFEIHNTTGNTVRMCGNWDFQDDGNNNFRINDDTIEIPPFGYLAIVRNTDTSVNGGVTGVRGWGASMSLSNSNPDEIVLFQNGVLLDHVSFVGGEDGESREVGLAYLDHVSNDTSWNWCYASASYGTAGGYGTPNGPPSCTP